MHDMTTAASHQVFRSSWLEVRRNADANAAGDRLGSGARISCNVSRILHGDAGSGPCGTSHAPAASHKTGIPACRRRARPAYEIPLFTRYAIKARR
jgi:hypothetical protein